MSNIKFDNINLLYLIILFSLLLIIPFIILIIKKKINFHNVVSLFIHLIICCLLTLSFAGIKTQTISSDTIVYILADVSCSNDNVLEEMDDYINDFSNKLSENNKLGVVAFGKDAIEFIKPGENIKKLSEAIVDKSATNIQDALTFTANLFEESYKKRIVLLSDGKQTDNDALLAFNVIEQNNIRLDAIYINSDLKAQEKEVQIGNIYYQSSTYKGNDSLFDVYIDSSVSTNVSLKIYDNNTLYIEEEVQVNAGENKLSYLANTTSEGIHQYLVCITSKDDTYKENNEYLFSQEVHEKSNILVIANQYSNAIKIKELITNNANVDELITYNTIPNTIDYYIKYDEIILSNVDLKEINNHEILVNIFETLVANYGKSLLTIGGNNTYFDGGFYQSKLNDMLPININPSDTKQRTALILLIDNSGSMSGNSIKMAKDGAIGCLDVLNENDYVGIITFEDNTYPVQPLRLLSDKESVIEKINKIPEGNGTMMTPALTLAYNQLQAVKDQISNREVIIISDGLPSDNGQVEVVEQMANDGIVVSTINIGAGYNDSLMKLLAKTGNGRSYTVNSSSLPDIMLSEVSEIVMDTYIEKESAINIAKKNDLSVKDISSLSKVKGFNYSTAKSNAINVLQTSLTLDDNTIIDNVPIYSYWQYGSGIVGSFTSDVYSWGNELFASENGKKFFNQMIKTNYPKDIYRNLLKVEVNTFGYTSQISLMVPKVSSSIQVEASIISPSNKQEKKSLSVVNGKYVQTFITDEKGQYQLNVTYKDKESLNVITLNTFFDFSYSCEYDAFEKSDNILLWQLVSLNGIVTNSIDEIVNIEQEDVVTNKYYNKYLLLASLILFIIDVMIRKLKLKDIANLFKKTSA